MSSARRVSTGQYGSGYRDPLARFTYDIDFVAGTSKGVIQPYGNNNADGRGFRDPTNVTAAFVPNAAGVLVPTASSGLRRSNAGHWTYPSSGTSVVEFNRDLTQVPWIRNGITPLKNQIGADGIVNAASSITAIAANGTILQPVVLASADTVFSVDVRRLVGTGTLEMTIDGQNFTVLPRITGAYSQQFIFQAAVTNPQFGYRIATPGDSFAVDFSQHTVPANGINIPPQYRYATVGASLFTSQSRPAAIFADGGPLIKVARGAFAFYWRGRSQRSGGGFVITGATNVFCSIQPDNSVQFSNGPGVSRTAAGVWRVGLDQVNRVAGYVTAGGIIKVACNGVLGSLGTGATLETALDHVDLGTNGAGQNSIYGINERFAIGPISQRLAFNDNELLVLAAA